MKTIRLKIIVGIVVCSIISSLVIGFFSISSSTNVATENAADIMKLNCNMESKEIGALINRVEQSTDILSNILVKDIDFEKFKKNGAYVDYFTDNIKGTVLNFAEKTDGVISAYVRYNPDLAYGTSGCFYNRTSLEQEFEDIKPTDFSSYDKSDTTHVGWYYIPVENGCATWMDPYMNENVNIYMTSYIIPLFIDGENLGIVGFDIDFSQITDVVANIKCYDSGYAYLLDASGNIMYHPSIEIGTNLADVDNGNMASVLDLIANPENEKKVLSYQYQNEAKSMIYVTLSNGMKLVITATDAEINADARSLSYLIVSGMLVAIIFSCVIGVIIGTGITRPIKKLITVIKQTADLDFRHAEGGSALRNRKDEIGVMAKAIHDMRGKLRDMVDTMSEVEAHISQNVSVLDSLMSETNRIAEDNSATTQELAAGMQETEANTTTIISNVEEVKERSHKIFELSQSGKASTDEVMGRALKLGQTTVASSEKTMRIFSEMQEKSQAAIEESKAVEQIQALTENIKKISNQTNLLALNANIEAARAGEAGRGFSVVATQIGVLASETFKTVEDINNIVDTVTSAVTNMTGCIQMLMDFIQSTVLVDYENFKGVGKQYQLDVEMVQEVINGIDDSMESLNNSISEITSVISAIGDTVSQATTGVSDIANKSSISVEKTVKGYQQLEESKQSVGELKHIMQKFTLP